MAKKAKKPQRLWLARDNDEGCYYQLLAGPWNRMEFDLTTGRWFSNVSFYVEPYTIHPEDAAVLFPDLQLQPGAIVEVVLRRKPKKRTAKR